MRKRAYRFAQVKRQCAKKGGVRALQEINSGYRIRDADALTQKAKTIYLYLRQRSGRNGKAWPGIKTIASDLGFSESTVRRGIRELQEKKLITVCAAFRENGGRTSNRYFL